MTAVHTYAPPAIRASEMARRIIRESRICGVHPFDLWADWQAFESDHAYALNVQAHIYRKWASKPKMYRRQGGIRFLSIGPFRLQWSVKRR
jgi:hypothetical protein